MLPKAEDKRPIPYQTLLEENHALKDENQSLRVRLEEAEELKRAISDGDLDAIVIPRPEGEIVFTLDSADHSYRVLVETMNEGTATIAFDGTILYCNRRFADLLRLPPQAIVGKSIYQFIVSESVVKFNTLLGTKMNIGEINLRTAKGKPLPVYISISSFKTEGSPNAWCVVVTDLTDITEHKENEVALKKAYEEIRTQNEELQAQSEELQAQSTELQTQAEKLQQANEALNTSEKRLQSIIDGSPGIIFIKDLEGRFILINKRLEELLGMTSEEIIGKTDYDIFPPEWAAYYQTHDRKVLETDKAEQIEEVSDLVDGRHIFLANKFPLYDMHGKPYAVCAISTDITERKRAEEALRDSEERYRAFFNTSAVGTVEIDLTGRIMKVNDRYCQITGYSREELLGMNVAELSHPDDRDYDCQLLTDYLSGRTSTFNVEKRYILKNSRIIWVQTAAAIVYDTDGRPIRSSAVVQDITERKQAEAKLKETLDNLDKLVKERTSELRKTYESLKESEVRFRSLFKVISSGVIIYDVIDNGHDFIFKDINPAGERIDNVQKENIIGKSLYDFFPNVDEMGLGETFRRVWNTGRMEFFPLKLYNDERIALWVTSHIYRLPSGELVAVFEDITERKKAEETMANIQIARKQEIHHRIKNNLQVISSLLDLQAEQFRDKEYIKDSEVLEAFRESQDRVISMALIHEELYKGGGFDTLNFSIYIEELAQNLLQTYCIGKSDISLNFDLADDIFFDMDVAVPLGMIVNELVSNSLKHAFIGRDRGEIRIKLHREEEHKRECSKITSFTLTISDNGVGIPENLDIENLDSLGMQLVTSLVDQLDGEFELKRKNGTEFTMKFAVTEKDSQAPASLAQQQLM